MKGNPGEDLPACTLVTWPNVHIYGRLTAPETEPETTITMKTCEEPLFGGGGGKNTLRQEITDF